MQPTSTPTSQRRWRLILGRSAASCRSVRLTRHVSDRTERQQSSWLVSDRLGSTALVEGWVVVMSAFCGLVAGKPSVREVVLANSRRHRYNPRPFILIAFVTLTMALIILVKLLFALASS